MKLNQFCRFLMYCSTNLLVSFGGEELLNIHSLCLDKKPSSKLHGRICFQTKVNYF